MTLMLGLAARNLARNARRSAVSAAAIAVGVTILLLLKGLSDGFIELVVHSVVDGRTGALQVHRAGWFKDREALPLQLSLPRDPALEARMRAVPGVKGIAPRILFTGLLSDETRQSTFLGTAIVPDAERQACPNWGKDLKPGGRDLEPGDYGFGLLGSALAKSVKGRQLTLSAQGPTGRMNAVAVEVKGVTETALRFENKRQVTVPLELAQDLLGMPGQVTEYAVAVEPLDALDEVAAQLGAALGPGYEVHPWRQVQPYMFGVVRRQEAVVGMFALIFFLAIVTGITNAMATSVLERTAEIGTMLAFGMRRREILRLFIAEAALLGALAGLLGAALGWLVVWIIAINGLPVRDIVSIGESFVRPRVSLSFTAQVVLGAVLVGVVAAALPALRAARLSPADALRSS
jgi:putative ABC transport system permease protein